MGATSLDIDGDIQNVAVTGFEPRHAEGDATAFTPELYLINESRTVFTGSVTVVISVVDGAGTAVPADSSTHTFELNQIPATSWYRVGLIPFPAVNATAAAEADQRYFTTAVSATAMSTHGTSAQNGQRIVFAWA